MTSIYSAHDFWTPDTFFPEASSSAVSYDTVGVPNYILRPINLSMNVLITV